MKGKHISVSYNDDYTYYQKIAIILLAKVMNPDLVFYLIQTLRNIESDDARDFHMSLRRSTKNLTKYYQNHTTSWCQAVPLSCDIPLTTKQWTNWKELKKDIHLFYEKFIVKEEVTLNENDTINHVEAKVSLKINLINLVLRFNCRQEYNIILNELHHHILGMNGSTDEYDYGGVCILRDSPLIYELF